MYKHIGQKKPAFWITSAALLLCIVLTVCLLTDKKGPVPAESQEQGGISSNENSAPGARMSEILIEHWKEWDEKDSFSQMTSSLFPGTCARELLTWEEATELLGFEPWNPLEDLDWLQKMNYTGADVILDWNPGLMHSYLYWGGDRSGTVSYWALDTGYASGGVRVVLKISSETREEKPIRNDRSTGNYDQTSVSFGKDGLAYLLTVTSFDGKKARDDTAARLYEVLGLEF